MKNKSPKWQEACDKRAARRASDPKIQRRAETARVQASELRRKQAAESAALLAEA